MNKLSMIWWEQYTFSATASSGSSKPSGVLAKEINSQAVAIWHTECLKMTFFNGVPRVFFIEHQVEQPIRTRGAKVSAIFQESYIEIKWIQKILCNSR